jgi:hypothetical protein
MITKLYTTAPAGYPVCVHSECPKAAECLHRIAFEELRTEMTYMRLLNPDHCTADDSCTNFRSNKPLRYARGFKQMQRHMYPDQYVRFMTILIMEFGRNPYYDRRRGVIPMPPEEQKLVLQVLKRVGVTEELKFDSYVDAINWYDCPKRTPNHFGNDY